MTTKTVEYDWSEFKRRLKEKFPGQKITDWCENHGFEYASVNNLRYGFWTSAHGYGPSAQAIIAQALKDDLIFEIDAKALKRLVSGVSAGDRSQKDRRKVARV